MLNLFSSTAGLWDTENVAAKRAPEVSSFTCGRIYHGKSAIQLARIYGEQKQSFAGQHFWARGIFVSMVVRDEEVIREYIRNREIEDTHLEQLIMWK